MHRMRCLLAKAGLPLILAPFLGLGLPANSRADLIRPNATQSFPDSRATSLAPRATPTTPRGYRHVPDQQRPSLLALGPNASSEYYVYDPPGQSRSQFIQMKLDSRAT